MYKPVFAPLPAAVYEPPHGFSHYFNQKSLFRLPYSLIPVRATYTEIIDYLKEEKILLDCTINQTPHDIEHYFSLSTIFKGESTSFGSTPKGHGMALRYSYDHLNEIAISKAIGEGLERYFLHSQENSVVKKGPKLPITDERLAHLRGVPMFLPEQTAKSAKLYDETRDKDYSFETVYVQNSITKETVLLPRQYVFWGGKEDDMFLYNPTTNGAGGHFTREAAIVSGLHEELQRDTFLLYWLTKKVPKKIDLPTIKNTDIQKTVESLVSKKIGIHVLYLESSSGIPTFLCILEDDRVEGGYALGMGGGTHASQYEEAISAAFFEALAVLPISSHQVKKGYRHPDIAQAFIGKNIGRDERIEMWHGEWAREHIAWFLSGETISLRSCVENEILAISNADLLEKVKGIIEKEYGEMLVYEVKSPILKQIGYHVVRVFLRDALQLHLFEVLATPKSARLAKALGKDITKLRAKDCNPVPHPFP